jgi:predicted transcriptional regulator
MMSFKEENNRTSVDALQQVRVERKDKRAPVNLNSVLEERFTHSILISLFDCGKQKKTVLLSNISRSSSIGKRIDSLETNGLIHITVDRFNKNTNWIELTDKGKEVSRLLIEIHLRMEE